MAASVSVIIPVYNAVRQLELVLEGFCRQTEGDFEVVIGDDGSGPEMRRFVESAAGRVPFPLRYVYQPDEGYRRSRVLNQASQAAATDYLIFVDGDCIPHREYVRAHRAHREPGTVLIGRRVNLGERLTARLTPEAVRAGELEGWKAARLTDALLGRGSHWDEGILLKNSTLRRWLDPRNPSLLGAAFSLEKSLFERVNGYNEEFVGYGCEDTELEFRLRLAGARLKWVRHQAIQYHLYHPQKRGNPKNEEILARSMARAQAACPRGLKNLETET